MSSFPDTDAMLPVKEWHGGILVHGKGSLGKGKIQEGAVVKGKITRIKHFGAFVEVYPCVEALLPQNELVQYQNEHGTILDVGDVIDTVILKFNPDDKRISLSTNLDDAQK